MIGGGNRNHHYLFVYCYLLFFIIFQIKFFATFNSLEIYIFLYPGPFKNLPDSEPV
jgi:hypothetical protein